jgi:thiol-disulfide isomerase/thioredoxin
MYIYMPVTTIEGINDLLEFEKILANNKSIILVKFSADWCGPCKKIAPIVEEWKKALPEHVEFYEIDIDESINLYSYFKNKKMLAGIPSIMCWRIGNTTLIPDYNVNNSDAKQVDGFFRTCEVCVK